MSVEQLLGQCFLLKTDIWYIGNVNYVLTRHKCLKSVMFLGLLIFVRFDACCHSFYLFYLFQLHTFIIPFIQDIHPCISIRRGLSPFLHCLFSEWKTWGAEPRFELGPAIQQASALYLLHYAAPYWATLQDHRHSLKRLFPIWRPFTIIVILVRPYSFKGIWVKWFNLDNLIHSH